MREIFLSKQNIVYSILLGLLIAIGIIVLQNWTGHVEDSKRTAVADQDAAQQASVAVVQFFQIDAQQGKDEWLHQLCALSTKAGCSLFTENADHLWKNYQQFEINTSAQVIQTQKVAEVDNEQIWTINIHLSAPLPGSNKVDDVAYVLMQHTEDGWKLDRFLFEKEIEVIEQQNMQKKNLQEVGE
jgi:hypothetical protein